MNSTGNRALQQKKELQPALARAAASTETAYYTWTAARNGQPVPEYNSVPLHSRYNPQTEAERTAAAQQRAGCTVFWGLGGGYHIRAYLKLLETSDANPFARILIVEPDAAGLQSILDNGDIHDILAHPAVSLSLYQQPEDDMRIEQFIRNNFNPVLQKTFACIPLRPVAEHHAARFDKMKVLIGETMEKIKADFSVQAHFGKIWTTNILKNLYAEYSIPPEELRHYCREKGKRYAVVAAAGPSLENAVPFLREKRTEIFLAATDTAYQTLMEYGISADILVTIDGQAASRLHIMKGMNATPYTAADMCANPVLLRAAKNAGSRVILLGGGHPLARAAVRFSGQDNSLYTAAGTVTAAAADIAAQTGFNAVILAGADFANTGGKPYARGTYLADLYGNGARRTAPAETAYTALLFRTECTRNGTTYSTALLSRYRQSLENFCAEKHIALFYCGKNTDILNNAKNDPDKMPLPDLRHRRNSFTGFFSYYRDSLQDLQNALAQMQSGNPLNAKDAETLYTVLPAASWFSVHQSSETALRDAIAYTAAKLAQFTDKNAAVEKTLL